MLYANSFGAAERKRRVEQEQLAKSCAFRDWVFGLSPMWTTDNAHEAANVVFAQCYALQYNRLVNRVPVSELI